MQVSIQLRTSHLSCSTLSECSLFDGLPAWRRIDASTFAFTSSSSTVRHDRVSLSDKFPKQNCTLAGNCEIFTISASTSRPSSRLLNGDGQKKIMLKRSTLNRHECSLVHHNPTSVGEKASKAMGYQQDQHASISPCRGLHLHYGSVPNLGEPRSVKREPASLHVSLHYFARRELSVPYVDSAWHQSRVKFAASSQAQAL